MDIKSLNIDNTNYPLCDITARNKSVHFYTPTGTAAVTTSPYCCAKYDAADEEITEYYNGLTIVIMVPVAGNATYGTCLQINSLGYHPIVYNVNSAIGTRHPATSTIMLVYNTSPRASVYIDSETSTSIKGCWVVVNANVTNTDTVAQVYCATNAVTADKIATCTNYYLVTKSYILLTLATSNTVASALTLNINSRGAKPLYINGEISSETNYSISRGTYLVYYASGNYYLRTDGKIPNTVDASVVANDTSNTLVLTRVL